MLNPALIDPVIVIKAISTSDTEMCIKEREQICPMSNPQENKKKVKFT